MRKIPSSNGLVKVNNVDAQSLLDDRIYFAKIQSNRTHCAFLGYLDTRM